jgi:U3 small nucleolar RNA-associated protein 13
MRIFSLTTLATPSLSKTLKVEPTLLRTLKPHLAPVITSTTDSSGSLLATGGADGVVKIWDIRGGFVTHNFHGHSGVISALHFFELPADLSQNSEDHRSTQGKKRKKKRPTNEEEDEEGTEEKGIIGYRLASGGEDGKVRIWNLHKQRNPSASVATLDSHVSVLRSLKYSVEENALLSAGRDRTVIVWDARTWKIRRTIPVLEEVETAGFFALGTVIYSGGENGRLRLWSLDSGREITKQQMAGTEIEGIQDSIFLPELNCLLAVQADQTLTFYDTKNVVVPYSDEDALEPLPVLRRICGTHGQILDVAYVGSREKSLLALATNSEDIRIIGVATDIGLDLDMERPSLFNQNYFGADYAILKGHTDIIISMSVDWSGFWLATGAKDNTARLWCIDVDSNSFECYATLTGHAESVSAVALPQTPPASITPAFDNPLLHPEFLITGSGDKTVKRWQFSKSKTASKDQSSASYKAAYTRKAHDNDINAIAIHPSGRFFASASMDKTVKIWDAEEGTSVGLLRGHKRGVWSVAFSQPGVHIENTSHPGSASIGSLKGYAATGAADRTVRVWNLVDFTCLATLEGHNGSVLKVVWLPPTGYSDDSTPKGPQVASAAADGLVKVWNIKRGECEATLDGHTDRVWALTVRSPISSSQGNEAVLVSGGADAVLTFWKDTTIMTTHRALEAESKRLETDQRLDNLVRGKSYRNAIGLALRLDRPGVLYDLFKSACDEQNSQPRKSQARTFTGSEAVDEALSDLSDSQIFKLLLRVRDWNANSRKELVAQKVLSCLVNKYSLDRLAKLKAWTRDADDDEMDEEKDENNSKKRRRGLGKGSVNLVEVLDGLRTWTERHHNRAMELWDESFLVEFTLREMDALDLSEVAESIKHPNGVSTNGHEADVEMED